MCIGKNVRLKPMKKQPEVPLAQASRSASGRSTSGTSNRTRRRAGRPRRRSGRNEGGRRRRTCRAPADRSTRDASITPVSPPITKIAKKPSTQSSGVLNRGLPPQSVAIQQKICTPLGIDDHQARGGEQALAQSGSGVANMWCTHTPKPMNAGRDQRQHQRQVAEDPAAARTRARSSRRTRSPG